MCVAENEATLLSTSPAAFAAAIDLDVAKRGGLALARHDPDRAVRPDPSRQLLERRQVLRRVGAEEHDVSVGLGPALGEVGCPVGEQRADGLVVDLDQRDAHPGPDPELVEQRRGVDPFHGRYRAI